MNGTPNCYSREISSPGWGFGATQPLPAQDMGLVQLSNRLLVPPDGLTFQPGINGEMLGLAWMALPFMNKPPSGDKSWTLFLNAANFKGPLAFWLPETWSRIASNYPVDAGRGLDARPGLMRSGAMEFNKVPWFESSDAKGIVYSKIPKLHFPVDEQGNTLLMENVTALSPDALYASVKSWFNGGSPTAGAFDARSGWTRLSS